VSTVRPARTTLERSLTIPVSIKPAAQTELYAKAAGYLKSIQRELTPALAAELAGFAASAAGPAGPVPLTAQAHLAASRAPEKDIGSRVFAGERLLVIDAPEYDQDIAERQSVLHQRQTELDAARTAIGTFQAAVEAVRAQQRQAEADILKSSYEHAYRAKQLSRFEALVRDRTITEDVLDERRYQVNAAQAALESSRARLQVLAAELSVTSSKLTAARADLLVKEALVAVARQGLERARLLAGFTEVHAPYDGIITYRGVDAGDLVQNSSTGQTRLLMTVAAVDRLRLVAQVPLHNAPWVRVGTVARLHDVDALQGWEFTGRVARIGKTLDADSRTMQVEIDLDNPGLRLMPGMYGQVTFSLQKISDAYTLPATAVHSRKGTNYLLLVEGGVARHQPVRLRYDDGREVEVTKLIGSREVPLDGSEVVIVSNKGEIGDGQRVRSTR
jgi:RND family efflux transporter MFP subunit